MISWMQKNKRSMVIVMWIAVISFIGSAGLANWNSSGLASGVAAKVGDVSISSKKLAREESDLYSRYRQFYGESFDRKKAEEAGLRQQAVSRLVNEAQILNLAKQYGLSASEDEIYDAIKNIETFQKDGSFDIDTYNNFLRIRNMKASEFEEEEISNSIIMAKLMKYINSRTIKNESNISAVSIDVYDKVAYRVIREDEMQFKPTDADTKAYWQENKANYKSTKKYKLDIYWTETDQIDVNDTEIEKYYNENNFKFKDEDGLIPELSSIQEKIATELRIKKGKKQALKDRVALKKGKVKPTESTTLDVGDKSLNQELWRKIVSNTDLEVLKPVLVGDKYATVKVIEPIEPTELTYDEAKDRVVADYTKFKKSELASKKAEEVLSSKDETNMTTTEWISATYDGKLDPLGKQESLQFLKKLFTSSTKNDIISLDKVLVVYKILDQKIKETSSDADISAVKQRVLVDSLVKDLNKNNPVQNF